MKKINPAVLLCLTMFIAFSSMAQERQNAATVAFEKKSDKLTDATGWYLNEGKWTDNKNQLSATKETTITAHGDNFLWMQMATMLNNGTKYHVIFFENMRGAYKYPEIEQDWYENKQTQALILTPDEYNQFKSAVLNKEAKEIEITPKMDRIILFEPNDNFDEPKLTAEVSKTVSENKDGLGIFSIKINSQTVKGQDIVRFRIPSSSTVPMDKAYFEVGAADFKKLLID